MGRTDCIRTVREYELRPVYRIVVDSLHLSLAYLSLGTFGSGPHIWLDRPKVLTVFLFIVYLRSRCTAVCLYGLFTAILFFARKYALALHPTPFPTSKRCPHLYLTQAMPLTVTITSHWVAFQSMSKCTVSQRVWKKSNFEKDVIFLLNTSYIFKRIIWKQ